MAEPPANSISWRNFLAHAAALALLPGLAACDVGAASHAANGTERPFGLASPATRSTEVQAYESWLSQAHASAAGHGDNFPLPSQF